MYECLLSTYAMCDGADATGIIIIITIMLKIIIIITIMLKIIIITTIMLKITIITNLAFSV